MGQNNVITVNNLVKYQNKGTELVKVLDGVNLTVKLGELVAIFGPPGSGKTTLLNAIGCLGTFDEGSVCIAGREVNEFTENELTDVRRNIGYVFQSFYLIPTFTVRENVALPLIFLNGKPRLREKDSPEWSAFNMLFSSVNKDPLTSTLREMGLLTISEQKVKNLTKTDKQRVTIARALVKRPSVILADEFTAHLEPDVRGEVFTVFRRLTENGATFVVATREPETAALCDRIVYLKDGKIVDKEESQLYT